MTNLSALAHADAPLFLFHLLEWGDTPFELDVDALNHAVGRRREPRHVGPARDQAHREGPDAIDRVQARARIRACGGSIQAAA
jgi:hypothetical protein